METLRLFWPPRVPAALKPRESVESQNAWNLYGDIAWYGVLAGISSSFLSVFTLRLGGTDTMVGLLSALPALVTMVFSIPGGRYVEKRQLLPVLLITGVLTRAGYFAIGLLPSFFSSFRAEGVVLFTTLLTIPAAISNVAFATLFARTVPIDRRAHVVSVRNVLLGITSTAAALLGGKLLDWVIFPVNYQVLFVIAFACSMLSIFYLSRIKIPMVAKDATTRATNGLAGMGSIVKMVRARDDYGRFTLTSFIFQWGLFFTAPLYSIYWVRTVHASDGAVGLINMVGSATTILFYPLWGRLTARRGNRPALILTTAGLAGYPFLMALSPTVGWMLFVSFWGGVFSSGQSLSFFNALLEVCPEQNRATRIAAYNALSNIAAFAAPLLSTSLTELIGIQAVLLAGAGLRLLGSAIIWQQRVLAGKRPRGR